MSAYVVAHVEVTDPVRYEAYRAMVLGTIIAVRRPLPGARLPARSPRGLVGIPKRLVIVEFPDADHARRWWASPEYAAAKAIRQATSVGTLVLLEGVSRS